MGGFRVGRVGFATTAGGGCVDIHFISLLTNVITVLPNTLGVTKDPNQEAAIGWPPGTYNVSFTPSNEVTDGWLVSVTDWGDYYEDYGVFANDDTEQIPIPAGMLVLVGAGRLYPEATPEGVFHFCQV